MEIHLEARRWIVIVAVLTLLSTHVPSEAVSSELPSPKVGLVITPAELAAIRERIQSGIPKRIWEEMLAQLPSAIKQVADLRAYNWPLSRSMLVSSENKDIQAIAAQILDSVPVVAIHYLVTGKTNGVADVIWCLRQLKNYNRLGWFAWRGGAFPQITYGGVVRVTSYAYDWLYDAMNDEERKDIEEYLVMCGRDFFRLNLIGPGMLMHHLRHHNQGDNAFCSGLAATLVTKDVNSASDWWLRVYVNTFLWNVSNAFGQDGQDLENALGGYWAIALDAVVQSAIMFRNTMQIDFLAHPHLRHAHRFWLAHLAPCKPVAYSGGSQRQKTPYNEGYEGYTWVQNAPASTVHPAKVSNTMLLLASLNKDGEGLDVWMKSMSVDKVGHLNQAVLQMGHTGYIGSILALNWFPLDLSPTPVAGPSYYFSERLALWRSGLRPGTDGMLTFNGGQMNFIDQGEQLGTGVGLEWHNPHFHYACAQNTLWTEGEDLQPGYRLTASWDGEWVKYMSATGAFSNTRYNAQPDQIEAYRRFRILERDILWAVGHYWVILDRVAHSTPRSHAFTWNSLNTDRNAHLEFRQNRVTLTRRQAALDFHFAEPGSLSFLARPSNLMPVWHFAWSEHGLAFDAREGEGLTNIETITEIPIDGFAGVRIINEADRLSSAVPTNMPTQQTELGTRERELIADEVDLNLQSESKRKLIKVVVSNLPADSDKTPKRQSFRHKTRFPIIGGRYYSLELVYSKFNLAQYHNPAWQVVATFYDKSGNALNKAGWENPASACLTEADGETAVLDRVLVRRQVSVPPEATTVGFEIQTWDIFQHPACPNAIGIGSDLYLHSLRMLLHPPPDRTKQTRFLAILQSRPANAPTAEAKTHRSPLGSISRFICPNGSHSIIVSAEEPLLDSEAGFEFHGRLGVMNISTGDRLERAFFERIIMFKSRPWSLILESDQPITMEVTPGRMNLKCLSQTALNMEVGGVTVSTNLPKGFYCFEGTTLKPELGQIDKAVENIPTDLKSYREKVGWFFQALNQTVSAHDRGENKISNAVFKASSVLQERFGPTRVNDGLIAEPYGDGNLYYNQQEILSAPLAGYGGDWHTATYPWPYRVVPSYWLAANEENEAWIEAEMPQTQTIKCVRLFNTCNAGFNDRAMIDFKVELFDEAGQVVACVTNHFGTAVPESVSYPEQEYGSGWRFWFAPETPVPHGEGWKSIEMADPVSAKRIRVTCLRYWGYGAGLNEFQAY